jgi:hypothetical protein
VEKCCRLGQDTDDMAHAHCMLDTQDYKHTLRICNNYCFPTATLVARTRPNVTFYVTDYVVRDGNEERKIHAV